MDTRTAEDPYRSGIKLYFCGTAAISDRQMNKEHWRNDNRLGKTYPSATLSTANPTLTVLGF